MSPATRREMIAALAAKIPTGTPDQRRAVAASAIGSALRETADMFWRDTRRGPEADFSDERVDRVFDIIAEELEQSNMIRFRGLRILGVGSDGARVARESLRGR